MLMQEVKLDHKSFRFSAQYADRKMVDGNLNVTALAFYEGDHVDMDGNTLRVTGKMIRYAVEEYNHRVNKDAEGFEAIRKVFNAKPGRKYAPISVDHEKNRAHAIVGRLLSVENHEVNGKEYLFAKYTIPEEDIQNKILCEPPLFKDVSLSVDCDPDTEEMVIKELSYVWDGALSGAVSFSKFIQKELPEVSEPPESTFRRIEASKISSQLKKLEFQRKQLEKSLQKEYNKREVRLGLEQLVREGFISRSDYKNLMIDTRSHSFGKSDVYLRSIRTVALSKKHPRGRISDDAQMTAFESFTNTVIENGGKLKMGMNAQNFAKSVLSFVKKAELESNVSKSAVRHDFANYNIDLPAVNGSSVMTKEGNTLDTDNDYTIKLRKDDMHRFAGLMKEGRHEDAWYFMKECSGMDFAKNDDDEDDDESDFAKETKDEKREKDDRDAEKDDKKEKRERERDDRDAKKDDKKEEKKSKDYSRFSQEEAENIFNFSKSIEKNTEVQQKLLDELVKLTKQGDK